MITMVKCFKFPLKKAEKLRKKLCNSINYDYNTTMIDMGLDLGLMQLEFEVNEMTKKL